MIKIFSKIHQKFKQNIDYKTLYVAIGFTVFCSLFGAYLFYSYYKDIFRYWDILGIGPKTFAFQIFNLCIDFILFTIYAYIVFSVKWVYKIILLFFLLISLTTEFGYTNFYGRFTDPNDLLVALTATGEQVEELMYQYINYTVLFALIGFLIGEILLLRKKNTLGIKSLLLAFTVFIAHAIFSYTFYTVYSKFRKGIIATSINDNLYFPLPVGVNTLTNTLFASTLANNAILGSSDATIKRTDLKYKSSVLPSNNIVLIVDESVRADHLSINKYHRPTSVYLESLERKGLLQNYGLSVSSSTASLTSNNLLISGEQGLDVENVVKNTYSNPSVFQYAKAMNYATYFFDPQKNDKWAGTLDDYNFIDEWKKKLKLLPSDRPGYDIDFVVASEINKILKSSTGNFIYVCKRGVHFPYESNYPENEQKWRPIFLGKISENPDRNGLINNYDNALLYNIDNFFKGLIGKDAKVLDNSIIIYTSDHGEMFLEDGKSTMHSGNNKLEASVPLVLIGKNLTVDTKYKASHHNILPTVLELMNYPKDKIMYPYSVSLLKATEKDNQPRKYVLPNLHNPKVYNFDN